MLFASTERHQKRQTERRAEVYDLDSLFGSNRQQMYSHLNSCLFVHVLVSLSTQWENWTVSNKLEVKDEAVTVMEKIVTRQHVAGDIRECIYFISQKHRIT